MLRKVILGFVILAALLVCGFVLAADGTWWNYVKNIGYAVGALGLVWALVTVANHFKITGRSFHLGTWLDAISDAQPDGTVGPKANPVGMAIVIGCFVLGLLVFAASFVQ